MAEPDARERVARALFEYQRGEIQRGRRRLPAWENQLPEYQEHMRRMADVAITALNSTTPG